MPLSRKRELLPGAAVSGFFVGYTNRTPPVSSALVSVARKRRRIMLHTPASVHQPVSEGLVDSADTRVGAYQAAVE